MQVKVAGVEGRRKLEDTCRGILVLVVESVLELHISKMKPSII